MTASEAIELASIAQRTAAIEPQTVVASDFMGVTAAFQPSEALDKSHWTERWIYHPNYGVFAGKSDARAPHADLIEEKMGKHMSFGVKYDEVNRGYAYIEPKRKVVQLHSFPSGHIPDAVVGFYEKKYPKYDLEKAKAVTAVGRIPNGMSFKESAGLKKMSAKVATFFEVAVATVDSPQFKAWFDGSKVVDANGQPLRVYHGTRSSVDFEEFSTEGPPMDEGGEYPVSSGSGADPTAYMGAHFAVQPEVASQFAMGQGWTRTRYEGGEEKPRVIAVYLRITNPKDFGNEENLRRYIYQGKITDDQVLEIAMQADDIDPWDEASEQAAQDWDNKYNSDTQFREETNRYLLERHRPEEGEDDLLVSAAQDLAMTAKSKLQMAGYDGIHYKNVVEGGTAYIAFEPNQIKSAWAAQFDQQKAEFTASKQASENDDETTPLKVADPPDIIETFRHMRPFERDRLIEEAPLKEVSPYELKTSQSAVSRHKVQWFMDNPEEIATPRTDIGLSDTEQPYPLVLETNDGLWLYDGNHRSAAAYKLDLMIEAKVVDLRDYEESKTASVPFLSSRCLE